MDIQALRDMLAGNFKNNSEAYGMSKREFVEFIDLWQSLQERVVAMDVEMYELGHAASILSSI